MSTGNNSKGYNLELLGQRTSSIYAQRYFDFSDPDQGDHHEYEDSLGVQKLSAEQHDKKFLYALNVLSALMQSTSREIRNDSESLDPSSTEAAQHQAFADGIAAAGVALRHMYEPPRQ